MTKVMVREYADGVRVSEEDFEEYDNSLPYYDDYNEFEIEIDDLEEFLG